MRFFWETCLVGKNTVLSNSGHLFRTMKIGRPSVAFSPHFLPMYLLMRFSFGSDFFFQLGWVCGAQGAIFGVDVHQVLSNALVSLRASATGNVRRLVPDDDVTVNPQLHKDPNTNMGTIWNLTCCWWKQLRLVVYPSIFQVLYIPGGAGFLPSTVGLCAFQGSMTQNIMFCLKIPNVFLLEGLWNLQPP